MKKEYKLEVAFKNLERAKKAGELIIDRFDEIVSFKIKRIKNRGRDL